jgi:ferredoxin--NADP+ reductase
MSKARLVRKQQVGPENLAIFTFKPRDELFSFKPGQFAHVGLDVGDEFVHRLYSIASSPYQKDSLEFYIVRIDDGRLTPHLFELREGDEVYYMGPGGKFILEKAKGNNLLLLSTGTGLAPYLSMVRKLHADFLHGTKPFSSLTIMQGVSYAKDLGYHEELLELGADESFGFRYIPTVSRPGEDRDYRPTIGRGRVNDLVRYLLGEEKSGPVEPALGEGYVIEEILEKIPPEDTTVYICGHPGMIKDIEAVVKDHGYKDILKEDYW